MKQKLTLLMVATLLFGVVFSINSGAWSFEKQIPNRIPEDQIVSQPFEGFEKSGTYCEIFNDFNSPDSYYGGFDSGMGFAVFMNPAQCGESPYPFEITDVHFYLYDYPDPNWPVALQVNIRDSNQGDSCSGPQDVLCSEDFSVDSDTAYPYMMTLNLSNPCCVNQPFFLEIVYTEPRDPAHPHPSLLMDPDAYPADTCDNWMLYSDQQYYEWYDIWSPPPPGDAIIRATGYTNDPECGEDTCWYWKADKPEQEPFPAPSGMPDFDQNQAQWIAYCGPTAVANCLWWFNSVPVGMTPPQLIELLAGYFHTNPTWGTYVDTMQMGLDQYFEDYGFELQETTFVEPDFYEMEDSLKVCQDIILLIGFWWSPDGYEWYREGGHFVTMAGVCSESLKIAISDPDNDGAVGGAPGRVRPPGHPVPGQYGPTLHNDPTYVSHDIYDCDLAPAFPSPGNPHWEINYPWPAPGKYTGMNVPNKYRVVTKPAPKDVVYYATEVEFAVMICPKPSNAVEGEEQGALTPKDFELYQNFPNPFNNETLIKFNLRKSAEVTLAIYNILGQKVRTLVKGRMDAGSQVVSWDGKDEKGNDLSSGIYFYQLKVRRIHGTGEVTETKRLVFLK